MGTMSTSPHAFLGAVLLLLCSPVSGAVCDPDCPGDRFIASSGANARFSQSETVNAVTPPVDPNIMQLYLLDGTKTDPGAVCLDGSPGGFYFRPALTPEHQNDWLLHFKGAGWCYDAMDCYGRSTIQAGGQFGSSTNWANTTNGWNGGILTSNCDSNPDFCSMNKVIMLYCDGTSFSGDRDDAVMVQGKPLYFRGKRIKEAILKTLLTDSRFGLSKARNVLLTGCSSGGLAAYLHADSVRDTIAASAPGLAKFRVAPDSGFFLFHSSIAGVPVYPDQIQNIFELSNATAGLNPECVKSMGEADKFKCMFAQFAWPFITTPTMILNSALDAWQTGCIFTAALPQGFPNQTSAGENGACNSFQDWKNCSNDPEGCNATQMATMNGYSSDWLASISASSAYERPGNGLFAHSCHTHCDGLAGGWHVRSAVGNVTMQEAVSKWWASDGKDPASSHRFLPCAYHTTTSPHKCNPSCP